MARGTVAFVNAGGQLPAAAGSGFNQLVVSIPIQSGATLVAASAGILCIDGLTNFGLADCMLYLSTSLPNPSVAVTYDSFMLQLARKTLRMTAQSGIQNALAYLGPWENANETAIFVNALYENSQPTTVNVFLRAWIQP